MYNVFISQKLKRLQNLNREPSNQAQTNPLEIIPFNKFVKVDRKQLKRNNQMFSKITTILNPYNIVLIMRVLISQVSYYVQFHSGLMCKFLIISNYFNGD